MRRALATLLIASGVGMTAGLVGEHFGDSQQTAQAQSRLMRQVPEDAHVRLPIIRSAHASPSPTATQVGAGEALAVMRIPRFGDDWEWAALEGTTPDVLANGPGHYPQTVLPGERGNAAFAAHRAGHGDPFIDFDTLQVGDHVVLAQGDTRWDYVIDVAPQIIPVTASWVLAPTGGRRLTLTTCWPKYGSSKRMYVRAHLEQS